jgi:hypothetical protein
MLAMDGVVFVPIRVSLSTAEHSTNRFENTSHKISVTSSTWRGSKGFQREPPRSPGDTARYRQHDLRLLWRCAACHRRERDNGVELRVYQAPPAPAWTRTTFNGYA